MDGDFAMLEEDLQGVLKALRKASINIVAIHHHLAGETPRVLEPSAVEAGFVIDCRSWWS